MKKLFKTLLLSVLLLLGAADAMAQFENGKVYRIVCSGTPSVSLGANGLSDVVALSTSETDRAQQWYVTESENDNYTFRSLASGRYLKGNNGTSEGWTLTENANNITVTSVNGNYCLRGASDTNGYAYMHKDAGNNIVSWENSAGNSQWTPIEVSYTDSELQSIWDEIETFVLSESTIKGYEEKLLAIFTDKACTELNSTYKSKSVSQIEADANYKALPTTLQEMVLKVKNDDWSEDNAVNGKLRWDSDYAKKFRVQMYEPYSIEGEITSYLRINAHCNMDNPTGIYANNRKNVYIMVEGEIKEGAELWVAHQTGFGATEYYNNASYTQLREGLNVVPYFNDISSLWINYVVHTYNSAGATISEKFPENRKLSKYKPLKIHIEGGHINGFYNAIGDFRAADSGTENLWGEVDNDDDWNYYMERAPLDGIDGRPNRDFPLLAHRQTLLFPLGPVVDDNNVQRAGLYHRILQGVAVPSTPNCYNGNGNGFGNYPGMGLSTSNGKINIMLEAWDRIMYSELASMGLVSKNTMDKMNALYPRWRNNGTPAEIYNYGSATINGKTQTYQEFCQGVDYSEYFNHHGCGVGWPNGYMTGGWRVTAYHYETMSGVICTIANEHGSTWGPAHEIGHQHQSIFNLNGQTEVTNNFFANVAVWYMGMGTSRYDGSQGSLDSVLSAFNTEGNDIYTNNIWALTHLYYRLWLYYHLAGNNTQFWPRLFELCRQVPIENGTQISGETSLLRFYQHACDAAGEDLTEFFRAHGFFEVMDNREVGDYYSAVYNVTQEQIDAAIKSVKDKNYPVNYAALLINDGTSETTFKHDGKTRRSLWDGNATAEFGSVNDFISGDVDVTTNYNAQLNDDGTITMTGGEGGVGFLMFNDKGELVAFSNKPTFKLSQEAKELYQSKGESAIVVVNADNEIIRLGDEIVPDPEGQYTVSVQAEPAEGGTATVNDKESVTVDAGSTVTLIATANSGYKFDGWYLNDVQVSTSSTYTPTVTGNVTYVAKFSKEGGQPAANTVSVQAEPAEGGTATVDGKESVTIEYEGYYVILNATANDGYNFDGWYLNGELVSGNSSCVRETLSGETYIAKFSKEGGVEPEPEQPEPTGGYYYVISRATGRHEYLYNNALHTDNGSCITLQSDAAVSTNNGVWYITFNDNNTLGIKNGDGKPVVAGASWADSILGTYTELAIQKTTEVDDYTYYSFTNGLNCSDSGQDHFKISGVNFVTTWAGHPDATDCQWRLESVDMKGKSVYDVVYDVAISSNDVYVTYNNEYAYNDGFFITDGAIDESKLAVQGNAGATAVVDGNVIRVVEEPENPSGLDKTALRELIADMQSLLGEVADKTTSETPLALQCNDANAPYYIYCNAPGASNYYGGDNSGVAAMLDVDENGEPINSTHLHTTYYGNSYDDDLDHYLRVDMGENVALESFKFAYISRAGNINNSPTKILVEGCNDLEKGDFEEIATITDANMSNVSYQSGVITNGKAYRYIRLMVKETFMNDMYSDHPYFVLSHFEMTACKTVALKDEFASPNLSLSTLLDANNKMVDAENVVNDSYVTQPVYDSTLGDLQAAYNALNLAKQLEDIPVVITTDVNNPVLYKIKINRSATTVLEYDGATADATKQVAVVANGETRYQAWYFMQGTDADSNDDILILPYWNEGAANTTLRLGAASTSNNKAAVWAVESGDANKTKQNWYITFDAGNTAEGWWNIRPEGKDNYFSNNGGVGNKMGFWNSSSDDGSEFQFVLDETDYSIPNSYYELKRLQQDCGGEKSWGPKIGQYTQETAEAFNSVNGEAKALLDDTTKPENEYAEMYNELLNAFNALEANLPEVGALYRIKSASTNDYCKDSLVYVDSENKPYFNKPSDKNLSKYIWQFEEFEEKDKVYRMKNLHTQSYIETAGWGAQATLGATASEITIDILDNGESGVVRLNVSGGFPLHAQSNGSKLVGYPGDLGSASAWCIEEVEVASAVHYPYTLSQVGYGTLMLGFDTQVSDGVTAYRAESVNGTSIEMIDLGKTIPANTAVILKRNSEVAEALDLDFAYNSTQGAELGGDNMLAGTLYKRVVSCEGKRAYVMQVKNEEVKMYWAYANFYADGKKDPEKEGKNDNGGHIMNSANRAYLLVPQVQAQQTVFNLRFGFGPATELNEVEAQDAENDVIYDLQGRKLNGITMPGFYIVNGKKVFVK